MYRTFTTLLASAAIFVSAPVLAQDWIERSNEYTTEVLQMQGSFSPEGAARTGLEKFDGQVTELTADRRERMIAANSAMIVQLTAAMEAETDTNLKQDLAILISSLEDRNVSIQLGQQYMMDWYDVPAQIFGAINGVLDNQVAAERHHSARTMLRRYVGLEPGTTPLTEQAKARFADSQGEGKVGPYRADVQQAIDRVPALIAGVRELFNRFGLEDAEAIGALETQLTDYAVWEAEHVLPAARDDFRVPAPIYANNLKGYGIDTDPLELVGRARRGFYETRAQMQAIAPQVALKFGWEESDYPSVITRLKQDAVPQDELEVFYRVVGEELEAIIRAEGVVSMPDYPVSMRLGTAAENAASPAPHMRPPRLVGNSGEQGTFVLTTGDPSAGPEARYDDFNFAAAAWMVSAHEARPGHELQFAQMVENGVSQARAIFARNSTNSEGWALYAEAEMLPFMPVEGQLIMLQSRLLRSSRAMLDPMLNLGLIDIEGARRILSDEARFSDAMVNQELNRYTFRAPGQAGSYYYGYSQLIDLRIETELALGDKFSQLAFNDFLLSLGVLPMDMVAEAIRTQFVPAQMAEAN